MDINWDRDFALDQAGGDEDLLRELLAIFSGTLVTNRQKIETALAAGDFSQLGRAAHALKGSASSLGFPEIAAMANGVEGQARNGEAGQTAEFLINLRALEEKIPGLA